MQCIAILNEKGGTAKTTTSVSLAAALGEAGFKVLLVDLDGQAASSRWLGVEEDHRLSEAILSGGGLEPIPAVLPNVDLAPASGKLDSISHDLRPTQGGQLRKALTELTGRYDYVLLDCPPSLANRLIGNALLAATHAIVPVEASILALDGLGILLTMLEDIREGFGHNIELLGVLLCRYDGRTRLSKLIHAELLRALRGKVFQTVIHENVRIQECPASGRSILQYDGHCSASEDYRALAYELVQGPQGSNVNDAPPVDLTEAEEIDRQDAETVLDFRSRAAEFFGCKGSDPKPVPPTQTQSNSASESEGVDSADTGEEEIEIVVDETQSEPVPVPLPNPVPTADKPEAQNEPVPVPPPNPVQPVADNLPREETDAAEEPVFGTDVPQELELGAGEGSMLFEEDETTEPAFAQPALQPVGVSTDSQYEPPVRPHKARKHLPAMVMIVLVATFFGGWFWVKTLSNTPGRATAVESTSTESFTETVDAVVDETSESSQEATTDSAEALDTSAITRDTPADVPFGDNPASDSSRQSRTAADADSPSDPSENEAEQPAAETETASRKPEPTSSPKQPEPAPAPRPTVTDSDQSEESPDPSVSLPEQIKVTGVMTSSRGNIAIINNSPYRKGQTFEGARVEQITASQVILNCGGRRVTLAIGKTYTFGRN